MRPDLRLCRTRAQCQRALRSVAHSTNRVFWAGVAYWWRAFRKKLYAAPRCSRSKEQACPACWDGTGCATDLLYQTTTERLVLSTGPVLSKDIIPTGQPELSAMTSGQQEAENARTLRECVGSKRQMSN
jgi:hypothetical protein